MFVFCLLYGFLIACFSKNYNKGFEESDDTDDDTGIYTPSPLPVPGKEDPPVPSRVTYMEPGMTPRGDVPLHQVSAILYL